ncbi:hypothetical protein CDAR_274051 [Caerostris darwini]|uniref:Uncharacterized protein n=1 Tax=Caerostris darwini TaxID=1538125 RepID=A0AAV4RH87_9ARAC|nr:hypothetical protein CDAR_274051 [Caerostris darwini]
MTFTTHTSIFTELELNTNAPFPSKQIRACLSTLGANLRPEAFAHPVSERPLLEEAIAPLTYYRKEHNRNSGPPRACQRQECLMRPTLRVTRRFTEEVG